MSATRFVPEVRAALIECTAAGVSLRDAANAANVRPKTVKDWLTRGRREDDGPYRDGTQSSSAKGSVPTSTRPIRCAAEIEHPRLTDYAVHRLADLG